jgi:hypothetical protein
VEIVDEVFGFVLGFFLLEHVRKLLLEKRNFVDKDQDFMNFRRGENLKILRDHCDYQ